MAAQSSGPVRPTLRQIAERLGVTAATVSLALRDSPQISTETRTRVKLTADAMGYRPDPEVGKLMQRLRQPKNQRFLATMCALVDEGQTQEPRVAAILSGARQRADSLGFALHLEVLPRDAAACARLHRTLVHRNIEALLLLGSCLPYELCPIDICGTFALVATGHLPEEPALDRVIEHQSWAITTLLRSLAAAGHRRIGVVYSHAFEARLDQRLVPLSAEHQRIPNLERVCTFSYHDSHTLAPAGETVGSLAHWLTRADPQALLVDDETIVPWLRREYASAATPPIACLQRRADSSLAGIVQPWPEIGAAAVDALHKKLLTGQRGLSAAPAVTLLQGRWLPGKS